MEHGTKFVNGRGAIARMGSVWINTFSHCLISLPSSPIPNKKSIPCCSFTKATSVSSRNSCSARALKYLGNFRFCNQITENWRGSRAPAF